MRTLPKPCTAHLAHREIASISGHAGDRIQCRRGSVWITQDRDRRDHLLVAGDSFTLDRTGTTIVYALADAGITVLGTASGAAQRVAGAARRPFGEGSGARLAKRLRDAALLVLRWLTDMATARWQRSLDRRLVAQRLSDVNAHILRDIGVDPGDVALLAGAAGGRVDPTRVRESLLARRHAVSF